VLAGAVKLGLRDTRRDDKWWKSKRWRRASSPPIWWAWRGGELLSQWWSSSPLQGSRWWLASVGFCPRRGVGRHQGTSAVLLGLVVKVGQRQSSLAMVATHKEEGSASLKLQGGSSGYFYRGKLPSCGARTPQPNLSPNGSSNRWFSVEFTKGIKSVRYDPKLNPGKSFIPTAWACVHRSGVVARWGGERYGGGCGWHWHRQPGHLPCLLG
jgi:hypothetical protein